MNQPFDLLCIGSGPAGQRAAVQAAKLGKRVAIIEKRRIVGGVCLDSGTIPSKTFREAVLAFSGMANRFVPGEGFPVRPRPTGEELLSRVSHVVQKETEVVESQLRRNDVVVFRGDASFHDPHTVMVKSEQKNQLLTANHILIAVGTVPSTPPDVVVDGTIVFTSDSLLDLKRIPKTLAVIGAGVIGVEYASMFAALGVDVILIDKRERPLEFLDREIVDELIHLLRNHNVTFRLGEAVERIEIVTDSSSKGVISLESGKRIITEMVLCSLGRVGATESLNLSTAGITSDSRGRLQVDAEFRTTVPHIFAAGDVIGYPSLAATSSEQGRLVACYAFGVSIEPMPAHFPIGIYAVPEISMVGATEQDLTSQKIPYETGLARYREIARGQIVGDENGLLKLLFHRINHRLLGVHVIGTGATELVHIGQAVIGLGGGLDYFMNTVFNYPTMAECYKVAALDAYNKLVQ
jgi:NAD(P) transhydrogenase